MNKDGDAFTPFIASVNGAIGKEATAFLKTLSASVALKWEREYSTTYYGLMPLI